MRTSPQVQGPASYFPSIEKTYGQPIAHWLALLAQAGPLKHMGSCWFYLRPSNRVK